MLTLVMRRMNVLLVNFIYFSPSNTTYVKHFNAQFNNYCTDDSSRNTYAAGYINTTSAIDAIDFKMAAGNMDGEIKMYGLL